jgi:uncharacterized protein GlcG (DUF336 family)
MLSLVFGPNAWAQSTSASILPAGHTVQVGVPAAPFATEVNAGADATGLPSASAPPGPAMFALAATPSRNGILNIAGTGDTGVFAVATVNVGATGAITAFADTGGAALPITLHICQTDPATGACSSPPAGSVTTEIAAGATPSFAVFAATSAPIPLNPATSRIFVRFRDGAGAVRGLTSVAVVQTNPFLSATDVEAVIRKAATAIDSSGMVIAVTDRGGNILGVFRKPNAPQTVTGNFGASVDANDLAIALARTGAYFSNNQAPLSSRTVRFISGIHFPPGVTNTANAALYGIENTNRGCGFNTSFNPGQAIPPSLSLNGFMNGLPCNSTDRSGCGLGIATGKADLSDSNAGAVNPGGVPIFKQGSLVGGIGVAGVPSDQAEFAAFAGSVPGTGFGPVAPAPGVIFLDGIVLPFVSQTGPPLGTSPGAFVGTPTFGPMDSPFGAAGVPDNWLVGPLASPEISAPEVSQIINQAVAFANQVRAAIRLPIGSRTRMVITVTDPRGNILGLFRMPDATIFSIDVAVAKARNVTHFSGPSRAPGDLPGVPVNTAVTNRTLSFPAQPLYPPGIDGSGSGAFFPLFVNDVASACSQGSQPANPNQSGIVFFPGSVPLYKGGQLVGGIGVSGDGVDQDDIVAAAGATGFAPPMSIRADQIILEGARLPFLKFPRNPLD